MAIKARSDGLKRSSLLRLTTHDFSVGSRFERVYWLAEVCVKRPVFALMLVTALVVAGIVAFPSLGVDRFPNMDLPQIYINATYVGAAAEEVESEVSSIIEDAVATVAGIEELRSISRDGRAFVIITVELDRDIDAAIADVRDAVAGVVATLAAWNGSASGHETRP